MYRRAAYNGSAYAYLYGAIATRQPLIQKEASRQLHAAGYLRIVAAIMPSILSYIMLRIMPISYYITNMIERCRLSFNIYFIDDEYFLHILILYTHFDRVYKITTMISDRKCIYFYQDICHNKDYYAD